MSRRNKPGTRARVVGGSVNDGIIVMVVRPYFYPQKFDGSTWTGFRFPWVITSLGRPLEYSYTDGTKAPPTRSGVMDDENLQPLDDDDGNPNEAEDLDLPLPNATPKERLAA